MIEPQIGMIVERVPGQRQTVQAILPAVEADGVPVRVHLGGDPPNSYLEWPWLVDCGFVIEP